MSRRRYSFDSSSLITAWEFYQRVPAFWDRLRTLAKEGRGFLIEEANREVHTPGARDWLNGCPAMLCDIDAGVLAAFQQHVKPLYDPDVFAGGANSADPWIVATAIAKGCTVVTEEHPTNSTKRLKVPDVCHRLEVDFISIARLVTLEDWTL